MARSLTRRGQFVTVVLSGDYGKPRPALVVQSNLAAGLKSVVVCPLTTDLRDGLDEIRINVAPNQANGLRVQSQIAIDKITAVATRRLGETIGEADQPLLQQVNRALSVLLGIV